MADRYLLESGAPDGYLLEDGTGVYLLEVPVQPVTQSAQTSTWNQVVRPAIQGGYSTVPNLLVTTLALFAAASTQRAPVVNPRPVTPAVQVFQVPNLLTSTLGVQAVPIPPGKQQTASAPASLVSNEIDFIRPDVLLDTVTVFTPPVGVQRTESAPPTPRTLLWDRGSNTLLFSTPVVTAPVGEQRTESAPSSPDALKADPVQNRVVFTLNPIASAQSEFLPLIGPSPLVFWQAPNTTINLPAVAPLPPGEQRTDSAPPTPRLLFWDRGSNTLLFTTPPAGHQQLDSAPSVVQAQITPASVNLPLLAPAVQAIPQGVQKTDSAPYAPPRLNVDQPVNLLCIIQPIPVGQQHTDSAPAWNAPVQSFTAPVIIPPVVVPLPIGRQQTDSATPLPPQVQGYEAPNATLFIPPPGALPPGSQHTDAAPIVNPPVWSQNSTIPPDLLPPAPVPPAPTNQVEIRGGIWSPSGNTIMGLGGGL